MTTSPRAARGRAARAQEGRGGRGRSRHPRPEQGEEPVPDVPIPGAVGSNLSSPRGSLNQKEQFPKSLPCCPICIPCPIARSAASLPLPFFCVGLGFRSLRVLSHLLRRFLWQHLLILSPLLESLTRICSLDFPFCFAPIYTLKMGPSWEHSHFTVCCFGVFLFNFLDFIFYFQGHNFEP